MRENTGVELQAQVIGVSLADIIRAYSSEEAKAAKETFVVIPTMAEVAAARHIMRRSGKELEREQPGPGSGLVPLFWCEALAVQTASGHQRKVLFFRLGDLQAMWKNLAEARKAEGEIDEMPDGPTVQVSDLQTMAGLLHTANKTDDVMFLPSSAALKRAQGQTGRARSTPGAMGALGGDDDASTAAGASADTEDGAASDASSVDEFEGEEEDATSI